MENVYSYANKVLVWLGNSSSSTNSAFKFMETIVNASDIDQLVTQKIHGESWKALEKLMRMKWSTRRWIAQEIALAKDALVFCGNSSIPWIDFCHVVDLFKLYYPEIKGLFMTKKDKYYRNLLGEVEALGACQLVDITNNLFRKSTDGRIERRLMTLESLISGLTMFDAGREHDYVYAMIAISKDIKTPAQDIASIEPDATPVATPSGENSSQWLRPDDLTSVDEEAVEEVDGFLDTQPSKKRKLRHSMVRYLHQNEMPVPSGRETNKLHGVIQDVRRHQPFPFPVHYNRSFLNVCRDFVDFAIMRSNSLDVICRPWVPKEQKEKYNLPSWLMRVEEYPFQPDNMGAFGYSACGLDAQPHRIGRDEHTNLEDGWGFCCVDRKSAFHLQPTPSVRDRDEGVVLIDGEPILLEQPSPIVDEDHRSLFLTGFVFDKIATIKNPAVEATIPDDWFRFAGWPGKNSHPPDALWRALVADRESDGSHAKAYYPKTLKDIAYKACRPGGALNVPRLLETPGHDKRSEKVLNRILAVVPNRRLFKTRMKTGELLGLAPLRAEKDDLVCILFGCSVPVILRRHEQRVDGKPHASFQLIGDAYVHGLMDGHAMEDIERAQQFELR